MTPGSPEGTNHQAMSLGLAGDLLTLSLTLHTTHGMNHMRHNTIYVVPEGLFSHWQ